MDIEILNWERFNPRKDIKATSWLRLQNNFCTDPDFWEFSSNERMVWIYILCEASQRYRSEIKIQPGQISAMMNIPLVSVQTALTKLIQIGVIICSEHIDVTSTKPAGHATNERTNKRTNNNALFDFEILYKKYPRKIGKARGIKKCASSIKSQEDYDKLSQSIDNYSKSVEGSEKKYIKHFSTFMGEWTDYIDFQEEVSNKVNKSKILMALKAGVNSVKDIPSTLQLSDKEINFIQDNGGLLNLGKMNEYQLNDLFRNI